jgi:hypothetical protein
MYTRRLFSTARAEPSVRGERKRNDTRAIQVTLLLSLGRVVVNWRNIVILLVDANFGEEKAQSCDNAP